MAGIQETKDVLAAAIGLGSAYAGAMADGRIGWGDIGLLVDPIMKLPAAFGDIDQIPAELKDLDESEKSELVQFVKDNLEIPQDNPEAFVERAIDVILTNWRFTNDFFLKVKGQ